MKNLDDITLILCIDKDHIEELKFAWETWKHFKPEIVNLKNKILIYDSNIENNIKDLNFIDNTFTLHKFVNKKYYSNQRDAMLTSWFEGIDLVHTKFYLKIDTDCYATNNDNKWIEYIEDRYKYVFISSPWGYTKNPERIVKLENWGDSIDILNKKNKLNLSYSDNIIIHPRIISFIFLGDTEWTRKMSNYCLIDDHYVLPVPSQDTFMWYCAERGEYPYKRIKFKKSGFSHTRLKKAKNNIIFNNDKVKLNLGCGRKKYFDWINLQQNQLDITKETDWYNNNIKPDQVYRILMEHVFEHLNDNDRHLAIQNFKKFIQKSYGAIRIAVPDGNHPNPQYIEQVAVCGSGKSAHDHKFLYNYQNLTSLFQDYGFDYNLLEYFDNNGDFHYSDWDVKDGFIKRSSKFDKRNKNCKLSYTSLIIDFFIR